MISINRDNKKQDEKFDQDKYEQDHDQDKLRFRQESEIVLNTDASAEFQTMQSEEALFENNNNNQGGQNNNTSSCQDSNIIVLSKSSHTENKLGVGQYK